MPEVTGYCMEWLNEAQIDAKYSVPASLMYQNNILASEAVDEALESEMREFEWEAATPVAKSPKLFGPPGRPYPAILLIGNSHMKMYAPGLQKLAVEYEMQIGFATRDGYWMDIVPWRDYGKIWRPRVTVMGDFFGAAYANGMYGDTFDWGAFYDEVLEFSDRFVVLGDIPFADLCCDTGALMKNDVYQRSIADGNFDFLTRVTERPFFASRRRKVEAAIQAAALLPRFVGRVQYIEMASYFQTMAQPYYLQLVDPISGGLVYRDTGHVNKAGARRVEQVFRKEVFGQPIC